ncbi:MAG: sugar phosphate isomerase/epimerase, partial [Planctomycetota bacterium]
MFSDAISRRRFIEDLALAGGVVLMGGRAARSERGSRGKLHVACNQYPWTVFYARDKRDFNADLDEGLGELAACRLDGYEPLASNPQEIDRLGTLLKKHGLEMRSLYVNSVLHEREKADQSIEAVLVIARKAKAVGTKIIVTNPSPIRWGGPQNKNDAELRVQATALE